MTPIIIITVHPDTIQAGIYTIERGIFAEENFAFLPEMQFS